MTGVTFSHSSYAVLKSRADHIANQVACSGDSLVSLPRLLDWPCDRGNGTLAEEMWNKVGRKQMQGELRRAHCRHQACACFLMSLDVSDLPGILCLE